MVRFELYQDNENEREQVCPGFEVNLALGKPASVSSTWSDPGYEADKLTDGTRTTRWSAADGQHNDQWAVIDFGEETLVNRVIFKEHKGDYFQMANYALQYWDGERYNDIAKGYTVGDHKTITFPTVKTTKGFGHSLQRGFFSHW